MVQLEWQEMAALLNWVSQQDSSWIVSLKKNSNQDLKDSHKAVGLI